MTFPPIFFSTGLCAVQRDVRFRDAYYERLDAVMTGWRLTASELRALPFADFREMADAAMRERRREALELTRNSAFCAWLQGAGGDKIWGAFCNHYGLTDGVVGKESLPTAGEAVKDVAELKVWVARVVKSTSPLPLS